MLTLYLSLANKNVGRPKGHWWAVPTMLFTFYCTNYSYRNIPNDNLMKGTQVGKHKIC